MIARWSCGGKGSIRYLDLDSSISRGNLNEVSFSDFEISRRMVWLDSDFLANIERAGECVR